ncbi:MAG TPA: hypothetical protein VK601_17725 [Kofleriaceae bacterium]|nr:hypothetical protein [Kofleriaceae bacterium]
MTRCALLIALALVASCKKQPPRGDLPPPGGAPPAPAAADKPAAGDQPAGAAPANPHGMNPHAGMGGGDNPHAGIGGGDNPRAGVVPDKTAPRALDKLPDGRLGLGPFTLAAPADWTTKPITSSMRAADFVLPGKPGADAELIVYYFGENGAGSVDDNLDRWLGQFEQPGGKPSREVAKIEKTKFAGQDATYVSVTGRFVAQAMPGATAAVDKADQAMLAAIVASPSGPYYFKLVGPKPTVDAGAKSFRAMLESLKLR